MSDSSSRIKAIMEYVESDNPENAIALISNIEKQFSNVTDKFDSEEYFLSQYYKSRIFFLQANFHESYNISLSYRSYIDIKTNPKYFFWGLTTLIGSEIFIGKLNEASKEVMYGIDSLSILSDGKKEEFKDVISDFYNNVGIFYSEFGNYEKSIEFNKKSLKIRLELHNMKKIASSYNNLGVAYGHFGNYIESFKAYENCLRIKKDLGDEFDFAITLMNLGENYTDFGEIEKALNCFDESIQKFFTFNHKINISNCYANKAIAYKRINKLHKALELQRLSYEIRKTLDNPLLITTILFDMFHVAILMEDFSIAKNFLTELKEISENSEIETIKQYYTIALGLDLKESKSARDHVKSELLLDSIITNPKVPFSILVIATMNKCELLITEISDHITDEESIISDLEKTLEKLIIHSEKQNIHPILAESYWLMAQLAYIKKENKEMDTYLQKSKEIAEERKLYHLLKMMSLESNKFYSGKTQMASYFKDSIKVFEQNKIEDRSFHSNDFPLKFLIFTKTGFPLYIFDYQKNKSFDSNEDNMVTAFLSAINAFSQKIFAGFIDYIKINHNHIILKYSEPLFFYFVFEGDFFSAVKHLTDIVLEIKNDKELWNNLITNAKNSSRIYNEPIVNKILKIITYPSHI